MSHPFFDAARAALEALWKEPERCEEFSMRDFEVSIYEIVPERRETCYLAQDILSSLSQEGSYQDV